MFALKSINTYKKVYIYLLIGYTKQLYIFYLLNIIDLVQLDQLVCLKFFFKYLYFPIGYNFLSVILLLYYYSSSFIPRSY
jgi:hypothetical protein